jgi:class 3 adenylate cyclase/pimeloyl-ACP methyl ester carboxylesterase
MPTVALAPTQYVRSGDVDIAYQVIGDGAEHDLVLAFDWASHLEALSELPLIVEFIRGLGRFARVVWFDMRGIGMSGHVTGGAIPVESWMDDLVAVMDAVGSPRATLVAQGHAAQMAVVAAATRPERVASLVLVNGFARFARADDYPAGLPPSAFQPFLEDIEQRWGGGSLVDLLSPSLADRPGIHEWFGRVERYGATPREARDRMEAIFDLDVRDALPLVRAPTLVVHSQDDGYVRLGHGEYLAGQIEGARLLVLSGANHWPMPENVSVIQEFVTGTRAVVDDGDRVLATVLVVDMVGSTEHASALGDHRWSALRDRFEDVVRSSLASHDGAFVDAAGDGVLATFDGPARAIRCASQVRDAVRLQGLEVRSGLHAGEIVRRQNGISGIAVHIGARVGALAAPGEVLVTRTVRDLVAGSGIAFEERGEHELKGVPDTWTLYAAVG